MLKSNCVYFDNNSTTAVCPSAYKECMEWIDCFNPSSDSKFARSTKRILEQAADAILAHCGVNSASHTVIFTSGATESNCMIIRSTVKSFKKKLREVGQQLKPHIIFSATEHHSIIACIKDLFDAGEIEYSEIKPTIYGNVIPTDVEKEIRTETCLITIMCANNEIPVLNDVKEIGRIAHSHGKPFHSDCTQVFGKIKFDMCSTNIHALSASAHKFYGPKGIGILIINNDIIEAYNLTAEINGSQQHALRGGTENVAYICAMVSALKFAFQHRKKKNTKLNALRLRCIEKLSKSFDVAEYTEYVSENTTHKPLEILFLGPPKDKKAFILPNTVLVSICKNRGKPFCNIDLKKFLDEKGFVISIGSACLTDDSKASHVLLSIGAPSVVRRGVIRISFGDYNTAQEVDKFVSVMCIGIKKQCMDLEK
jgi:cysteine desulfurase